MEQIKNIVFDFGGVLIDWNPEYLYKKVFEDKTEMEHFLNNVCTYKWNVLQDAGRSVAVATVEKQQEFPEYKAEIAMYYGRWAEMLGGEIVENSRLVKPLSEKYNTYGLTNWSAETIPLAIERYDFFNYLKGMVVSGDEKLIKPDPKLYYVLLDRFNINPEETLFIDDSAHNIDTAKLLGFETIHYTPEINLEDKLKEMGML
ncbi:MAG: HAD family hydrolase [Petrimonas sp.]|jgi:2-haloacid dehalogenase|nr:MAG: Phosphorylated carbohydrates phosphatase [Bacteroidetes bacterium ADurb.BinA174]